MLSRDLRIGFLSPFNPRNRRLLSGTIYSLANSLNQRIGEVVWVPVIYETLFYKCYLKLLKEINRLLPFTSRYFPKHPIIKGKTAWKKMDKKLLESCDVLFVPMLSEALYELKTSKPIIYLSDCTYSQMVDYYFFGVHHKDQEERERMERVAIQKADALVYPCRWAADSAVRDYDQTPDRITIAKYSTSFVHK